VGQCSRGPRTIFALPRGLFFLVAVALALPFAAVSAAGSAPANGRLAEMVVTLEKPPLAHAFRSRDRASDLRTLTRDQDRLVARIRSAVPQARVRWRYRVVLDGLAVVAPARAAATIAALPGVAHVYPSVRYHRTLFGTPKMIGAPQVWGPALATAGNGVKIGIIDDGVDRTHPFFSPTGFTMPPGFPKGNAKYTTPKVIVARSFPAPDAHDRYADLPFDPVDSEHGTHVAGIVAGDYGTRAPGPDGSVSVSGIAPHAYIGNYRVLTIPTSNFGLNGNSPEIVAGIEQAVLDGMDVINLSLGEPEITPSRDIVVQAIDAAADAGVVPVIAAGNDFDALGFGSIDSPGSAPKAITVAAATRTGAIAGFSSGGPAPVSLRLKPDVSAPGSAVLSSVPAHDGEWAYFDGTSMATPHVAGAAAVLRERHPAWTVAQIKSALVLTGSPIRGQRAREAPPTREGGGMIWLPRADDPLVFASPTSLSFGLLRRGQAKALRVSLADAGGGAGAWRVAITRSGRSPGVALKAPKTVSVPGRLTLRASASARAATTDTSGFVVLSRAGQTRRIPFWLHVTADRLAREPYRVLPRPGVYRGDTRGRPSLVTTYRYPDGPGGVGVLQRLAGPEQVFRFVVRRRIANAGAVVLSQGPGVHVSPRLVRGSEDRLAGVSGLPLRANPYQPDFYGLEPVVGVFRPARGAYDLVFDTPRRGQAGSFTFRFWVDDTSPPTARVASHTVALGTPLHVRVADRGSGVDPESITAQVDGRFRTPVYTPSTGDISIGLRGLARGRHRLVFSVADYQETKNNENGTRALPNTRGLTTTFVVR